MKKIYLIFIIFFSFGLSINTSYSNFDDYLYNQNLQYEYTSEGEVCFTQYYYNNKFYKIYMPCSRDKFIRLEFDVQKGEVPKGNYLYKLVFLNQLLIKKGLEPLYY